MVGWLGWVGRREKEREEVRAVVSFRSVASAAAARDPLLSPLSRSFLPSASLQLTDRVVPARQHPTHDPGPDLLGLGKLGLGVVVEELAGLRPSPLGETFFFFFFFFCFFFFFFVVFVFFFSKMFYVNLSYDERGLGGTNGAW